MKTPFFAWYTRNMARRKGYGLFAVAGMIGGAALVLTSNMVAPGSGLIMPALAAFVAAGVGGFIGDILDNMTSKLFHAATLGSFRPEYHRHPEIRQIQKAADKDPNQTVTRREAENLFRLQQNQSERQEWAEAIEQQRREEELEADPVSRRRQV